MDELLGPVVALAVGAPPAMTVMRAWEGSDLICPLTSRGEVRLRGRASLPRWAWRIGDDVCRTGESGCLVAFSTTVTLLVLELGSCRDLDRNDLGHSWTGR